MTLLLILYTTDIPVAYGRSLKEAATHTYLKAKDLAEKLRKRFPESELINRTSKPL